MMFFTKNKNIIRYIILSFFLLFYCLYLSPLSANELWNYGFSYAIRKGEVLYRDFNLVVGPFYPFLMTIPLLVSNSLFSYLLFHVVLLTCFFALMEEMYSNKMFLGLLLCVMFPALISPSYNLFVVMCILFLVFLEKSSFSYKDWLIGIVIACCFFTKQSTGFLLCLPTLFFLKNCNWKKRVYGFVSVSLLFLFYFLITHSLFEYFNYCFLGLLDFGDHNTSFSLWSFGLLLLMIILSVVFMKKSIQKIPYFYYLCGFSLAIPIIDFLHLMFVFLLFAFCLMERFSIPFLGKKQGVFLITVLFLGIVGIEGRDVVSDFHFTNPFLHFEFRYFSTAEKTYAKEILTYLDGRDFVVFSDHNYFYKIAMDQKLDSLDIVNYGNHGYHGSETLLLEIQNHPEKLYLLPHDITLSQIDKKGYNTIIQNAVKIDSIGEFDVYEFQ